MLFAKFIFSIEFINRTDYLLYFTDSNNVVLRKKHNNHTMEEDERPMRRVSYLRATANDCAFNIDSDLDSSPLSQPPDTPDTEDTNQSYPHHILKRYFMN